MNPIPDLRWTIGRLFHGRSMATEKLLSPIAALTKILKLRH